MKFQLVTAAVAMLVGEMDAVHIHQQGVTQPGPVKYGQKVPIKLNQTKSRTKTKTRKSLKNAQNPGAPGAGAPPSSGAQRDAQLMVDVQGWESYCYEYDSYYYCYYTCEGSADECSMEAFYDMMSWEGDYGGTEWYGEEGVYGDTTGSGGDPPTDDKAEDDGGVDYTVSLTDDELAEFNKIQLDQHNEYRKVHAVKPLAFDLDLAKESQAWADKMLKEDKMYHSDANGYGENLAWMGGSGVDKIMRTTPEATKMWYSEIDNPGYDFENPGFTYGTGHFTQVVWKGSTKLGCGVAGGYVCCRYTPAGNISNPGYFEDNVFPPTK